MTTIRQRISWMAAGAALLLASVGVGGAAFLYSGYYNVAASSEHTAIVYWLLEQGMRASVRRHAAGIEPPPDLNDPERLRTGAHCFQVKCAQCHGAPGVAPNEIGLGLLPIPNSLAQTALDWPVEKIYWVTRSGIRMAGMPAWEYRLSNEDLWAIAAFIDRQLPLLTVAQYRELTSSASEESCSRPASRFPADARRGLITLRQYGCHGCHKIPGVTGPDIYVGPPLENFGRRALIAGVLPNTQTNLIEWLREPQAVNPRTLMPNLGVTEQHALDMAAYLQTLK
jgi:mono/diheme cytochrome c family protein